jgi:hypothetical protein
MADNTPSAPGGGGGGHFTAPAADKPAEFGTFNSLKDDGKPPTLQERLASFKQKAAQAAATAYESTVAATATVKQKAAERDWTKEQQVLGRAQKAALGAAEKVGTAASAGGNWVWNASNRASTALKGDAITVLARQEAGTRPVPRTVLVCCSSLIATGPGTKGIFSEAAGADLVTFLLNSFEDAHGCFLPPPGTSPHVVANVLKQFFATLPEPLLTYKTLPSFVDAGGISSDTAALAPPLLMDLPATNLNALWLLLETLNRVAADAAENEMDARALAAALAPSLAWHPPPPKTLSQGGVYTPAQNFDDAHLGLDDEDAAAAGGAQPGTPNSATVHRDLSEEEAASVARVLEFYISNFAVLSRRVYWTPSGQPALLPD